VCISIPAVEENKVVTTRIEAAGNEDGTSQSATEIVEAQRWKGSVKERPGVASVVADEMKQRSVKSLVPLW